VVVAGFGQAKHDYGGAESILLIDSSGGISSRLRIVPGCILTQRRQWRKGLIRKRLQKKPSRFS